MPKDDDGKKKFDWKAYYASHKEVINARRRSRYKTDSEYRSRVKKHMKEYAKTRVGIGKVKRNLFCNSCLARWRGDGLPEEEVARRRRILGRPLMPIMVEFNGRLHTLYPISLVGAEIGFFVRTLRNWEATRVIPPPVFRDSSGRRWYTETYIRLLKKCAESARNSPRWQPDTLRKALEKVWNEKFGGWEEEAAWLKSRSS